MSKVSSFRTDPGTESSEALRAFQKFNNLPVTGQLDEATVNLMNSPRCGLPDVVTSTDGMPQPYVVGASWNKLSITWKISIYTPDLTQSLVRSEIARAFKAWGDVSRLTFTESASSSVDIEIKFVSGNHGDGGSFDGPSGVLAHAFFPPVGDTHFDDAETWVVNQTGIDLFIVAAHEFGHALGLDHSQVSDALMAPYYTGYVPNYQLRPDDIAGIQAIYGAPIATDAPTNPPTNAPTNPPTNPPTDSPPNPPTNPPTRPPICSVVFDSVTRDTNSDILAFVSGKYVLIMDEVNGLYNVERTDRLFRGAPRRPDATFTSTGSIYFIAGKRAYQFNSNKQRTAMFWIRGAMPQQPQAAFAVNEQEVYMIGKTKVWKVDLTTRTVVSNTEALISQQFPGIPDYIRSAFLYDSSTVFFFKGTEYYIYDLGLGAVIGGPLDAASQFIKGECTLSK